MALPPPPLPLPPLTYYAMNGVSIAAILCGVYLIFTGLPSEPTFAENAAYADALLERAESLAAGGFPNPVPPPGQSINLMTITFGVQAILAGLLLAGFGTVINLLHRIAHRP